jgi:hypothetical protein
MKSIPWLLNLKLKAINKKSIEHGPKKNIPFADMAPPVTHPATTVFVVSCFARAYKPPT